MTAKPVLALLLVLWAAPALAAKPLRLALPTAPGQTEHRLGAVTLNVTMPNPRRKGTITLTISSPGAKAATLDLSIDPQAHDFEPRLSLVEMDGTNMTPEILVSRFTGGAHCCAEVNIFDLVGKRWSVVDGGHWDGEEIVPEDADGDGELEIVHGDDRFLYLFSCYACAGSPNRFFKLVEGALVDVTASPLFRGRDEKQLPEFRRGCAAHDNEACAGFVALMTRLGRHDQGWQFMLKKYDRAQDQGLTRCAQYNEASNCTAEIKYPDYPAALDDLIRRTNEWFQGSP